MARPIKIDIPVRLPSPSRLARIVGDMAEKHFKANFDKEGFVNNGVQPWKEVKRRDPSSPWYGFSYRGKKLKGKRRKGVRRRSANFSNAATKRKILTGPTGELRRSLKYNVQAATSKKIAVGIISDKPYATVQNEGGTIRIFGKASAFLPARPFVGYSKELEEQLQKKIFEELNNSFKRL